jgi:hypothetical protein
MVYLAVNRRDRHGSVSQDCLPFVMHNVDPALEATAEFA